MSAVRFPHIVLAAAGLLLAGLLATPHAAAATATSVTFEPGQFWAQETGRISRQDNSFEYAVQVEAGKTLQINLLTRDPNIFFQVRSAGQRKPLVDTLTTGATTWSAPIAAAGSYTIRVYAQPEALDRGKEVPYALQVGQYSAADMRVPATTVAFEGNSPWAQYGSTLDGQSAERDYSVEIAAGQMLAVNLVTKSTDVHFKVTDPATKQTLVQGASPSPNAWTTPVTAATTYLVSVYADASTLPPGVTADYTVQIGHYPQPAAAGSTALPAAAVPAAPGSSAPAPAPAPVPAPATTSGTQG